MSLGNRFSQHSFAMIPSVNIGRSQFDRSYSVKSTFDFDYLIPIMVDEVLPGDTYNVQLSCFARLATQIVPIMDNMHLDFFFFFVPNRLVWTNWERFNGAQDDPADTIDYVLPTMPFPAGGPEVDTIFDHMGLPTDIAAGYTLQNTLPLRCYNKIYNAWFRDQNLQDSVLENMDDGPDAPADYTLLKRGKRHDYFTSCLPWPQKGDAVELPLGTKAIVTHDVADANAVSVYSTVNSGYKTLNASSTNLVASATSSNEASALYANLSTATAATINQLRQAMMVQSLIELDARGGTRYVEILRAHFGVISPDFRLQRPEYLGGGSVPIQSHPVPQTSSTSGSNVQAQLAAFATASGGVGFTKSFVEHGYIIGLACARADITYQQGLNRMWTRSTRYDFFWPKLQQLGEQAVLNKEIYVQGTSADNNVFGYQERYSEYKYKPSEIHGRFRSTYATSLDQWHLAEEFGSLPALNSTFIVQNTPIERAIAIDTEPDLIYDSFIRMKVARPMATYSVPATLGRF